MEKKRNQLFILGTYGCGNRGDEAILASIVSCFQDDDIWITNGRYDDMRKYFPVKTVRCRLAEGKITLSVFLSILFHSFHQLHRILRADTFFWQWVAQLFGKKLCHTFLNKLEQLVATIKSVKDMPYLNAKESTTRAELKCHA